MRRSLGAPTESDDESAAKEAPPPNLSAAISSLGSHVSSLGLAGKQIGAQLGQLFERG